MSDNPVTPSGDGSVMPEYRQPPTEVHYVGRRPYAVSEIFSWAVVLVLVLLTATVVAIEQAREKGLPGGDAQLTLSAKYAVGIHAVMPGQAAGTQLLAELDGQAKSPQDRFRMAILSGELVGKEEALRRLDVVAQAYPALVADAATARTLYDGDVAIDAEMVAFRKKWAWFADLVESYGKNAGDPVRARMLEPTYWTIGGIVAVVMGGLGAGLTGLVLLIVGIVLVSTRRLKPAYGTTLTGAPALPADRRAYIEGFAIFIGLLFGTEFILGDVLKVGELAGTVGRLVALPTSVLVGLLWPLLRGNTWPQWRAAMGLHRGRGIFREMVAGVAGYLAGIPLLVLGAAVSFLLVKLADVKPTHPINEGLEHGSPLLILLLFLAASVWAPITEELTFRGALFSHLRERYGPFLSAGVVGLLFALVHPQGWPLVPVLGTMGFVLAMIRQWRGSIIGCMTAHALHNTMTLIVVLVLMR